MNYPVKDWQNWYDAQPFGTKTSYGYHEAVDLNLKTGGDTDLGQDILAISDGIVTSVHIHTSSNNFGKHLHIKHDGPWGTVWCHFAHCAEILVSEGQQVKEGQLVARVGKTGTVYSHLHWAIKLEPTGIEGIAKTKEDLKKWTDPIVFVEKWRSPLIVPLVITPQTRISQIENREVQEIRSILNDNDRTIRNLKMEVHTLKNKIEELEKARPKLEIIETGTTSTNQTIEIKPDSQGPFTKLGILIDSKLGLNG